MIEVKARIFQRTVFITGECIECQLLITNCGRTENEPQDSGGTGRIQSNKRKDDHDASDRDVATRSLYNEHNETENLAWASALIYCHCNVNEQQIKLPKSMRRHRSMQADASKITSFSPVMGEKGHCLFSTAASVLFCDLKLKKGESKMFVYSQLLPHDFPPSYKGLNIKLSYKVCIGIGRIGRPLSMLRLPFRLYEVQGILNSLRHKSYESEELTPQTDYTSRKLKNPFLKEDSTEQCSILDAAMESLTALSVKRNKNTYNIQSVKGSVGKFCLSKHYYRLGEDVLGKFDFTEGPLSCIKYTVSLQVEERISKNFLHCPLPSDHVQYITLSTHEECCKLATKTHFLLPIPVTATADFSYSIVSVSWRLHFEFIIERSIEKNEPEVVEEKGVPVSLQSESMLWDLPLHVLATNPIQASLMLQAESEDTIFLKTSDDEVV